MSRLEGKVAIVTGAGRQGNIGVAVCEAFLREGAAAVVGTDLRTDQFAEISARLEAASTGGKVRLLEHDVTDESSWSQVLAATLEEFGGLDVLVNNAGASINGGIQWTSLADMRRVMAINHDALFLGMATCVEPLAEAVQRHPGGGSIINNLSMSSYLPNQHNVAYTVSKAAARMLTICAAEEFGAKKVRVNSVHPGLTLTPLIDEALDSYVQAGVWADREAAIAGIVGQSPLNISSQPEDTAHAFVYFASEEARYVTGAALYHDGGLGRRF